MVNFTRPSGLWIPLITPFHENAIDKASVRNLVTHYARKPIDGLILAATTGEGHVLSDDELKILVVTVVETLEEQNVPLLVYMGISASEPNPAPVKYWLWRDGLISSPEARIPFMPVSADLAAVIDQVRSEKSYVIDL